MTPQTAGAPSATRETFVNLDPATGKVLSELPVASQAEVHTAVQRARAASEAWAGLEPGARLEQLARVAPRIEARAEEIADLITREMGKPRREALAEVRGRAEGLVDSLETARRALAPIESEQGSVRSMVIHEPHGVVAAITPWNFPVGMPMSLLTPALAMGNAVVFKPSEQVPLTGAALHACFAEELPGGVMELVQGPGQVGAQLVDEDVDMISFVGSRDTGRRIMAAASGGLKRLVLELGGKDPLVVFADADLDAAAEVAVRHSLRNTGQVCCSVERVYVAEEVAGDFEQRVQALAAAWTAGSGFDDSAKMGPLVSADQRDKVAAQVDAARSQGARVLTGAVTPEGPGNFYPATVLADVTPEMSLARDETFGPVVTLMRFSGEEQEAVRLANDTPYGLGANVFTADTARGLRVAKQIRSGQVGVNRYMTSAPDAPWVGHRHSGFGFVGGVAGYRQFSVPKTISVQG